VFRTYQIRAMTDGVVPGLTEAGPSTAVEVMGLNMVPYAGDEFTVAANESEVRTTYAVAIYTHSPSKNSSIECASI
jgi:translation initiation factor IF-2